MRAYILNETSIKVNWTISSQVNGYVIVYIDSTGNRNVLSTTETEIVIPLSTYNISVYSYKDVPSANTQTFFRSDSELTFNINHCFIDCLVPSPVTSLSVTNVSSTDITVNWISPSIEDGNYVTFYNISYTPSCPELSSINVTAFVFPYTTTYSYTLRELYSGMSYTITVRAGNILGVSNTMNIVQETKPTSNNYCWHN